MPSVSRTVHTPSGWTVSAYEDGSVQIQAAGEDPITLPPEAVEAMDDLRELMEDND